MQFRDIIYGTFTIEEPVILELLHSAPVQRTKRISQYGLPPELYHLPGFTRYEHCLGVMLLLRKLKASPEEQIAGLLHDISHTAFSHVADWVIGDKREEDYQDKIHEVFISRTEIPSLLGKYGIPAETVTDYQHFTLLEREKPDLCADRFDYAIREFKYWANPAAVSWCVDSLVAEKGMMIFTSRKAAETFAYTFLRLQREHWGSAETSLRYQLLSEALKKGLEQGIIEEEDFFQDDGFVLDKMGKAEDDFIQRRLALLRNGLKFEVNNEQYTHHIFKKFRYVDPLYFEKGTLERLSAADPRFAALLKEEEKVNKEGTRILLLNP